MLRLQLSSEEMFRHRRTQSPSAGFLFLLNGPAHPLASIVLLLEERPLTVPGFVGQVRKAFGFRMSERLFCHRDSVIPLYLTLVKKYRTKDSLLVREDGMQSRGHSHTGGNRR